MDTNVAQQVINEATNVDTGAPIETAQAQAAAAGEALAQQAQAQQAPQYSVDPQMIESLNQGITGLNDQMKTLGEQVSSMREPEVKSSEQIAMERLAEQMGIKQVADENAVLKQQLMQMQESQAQLQEKMRMQEVQRVQQDILTKNNVSEEQMQAAFESVIKEYGQDFAMSLNNPAGWDFIIKTRITPNANISPDPILTSTNAKVEPDASFSQRMKQGKLSDEDINNFLLSNLK